MHHLTSWESGDEKISDSNHTTKFATHLELTQGQAQNVRQVMNDLEKDLELRVTFRPGKLGIRYGQYNQIVYHVEEDGQAKDKGIEIGMKLTGISGQNFSCELFDKEASGEKDFQLTFEIQGDDEVHSRKQKLAFLRTAMCIYDRVFAIMHARKDEVSSMPPEKRTEFYSEATLLLQVMELSLRRMQIVSDDQFVKVHEKAKNCMADCPKCAAGMAVTLALLIGLHTLGLPVSIVVAVGVGIAASALMIDMSLRHENGSQLAQLKQLEDQIDELERDLTVEDIKQLREIFEHSFSRPLV
jgi:hypothetical protein